jgi:hypothetical protein
MASVSATSAREAPCFMAPSGFVVKLTAGIHAGNRVG